MRIKMRFSVVFIILVAGLWLSALSTYAVEPEVLHPDSVGIDASVSRVSPWKNYSGYWWQDQRWYKDLKTSSRGKNIDFEAGVRGWNPVVKKFEWQNVLGDVASSYSYQLKIQSMVQGYRNMLFHGLSAYTQSWLEGSPVMDEEVGPDFFGLFYRSVSGTDFSDPGFGKIRIDPSVGFGSTGIKLSYRFLYGTLYSSWNMDRNKVTLKIKIPLNSVENVFTPEK